MKRPLWILIVLAGALGQAGCCTREMAVAMGEAARESFFREQDRLQQRFVQVEADAIQETMTTIRDTLDDEETRELMRQLAAETVATADESMQSSIPKWGSMLRQQQEQLRSDTLSTLQSMSEQVQTSYREVLEASVTRTRETLREDAVLDEETRTQLRDSVVPLVHEVMEETGQKASEEFATAVQDGIDRVSVPLVQGAGLLIVVALVTMAIPSLLLFVSYHRSVAALNALRELERARGSSTSPAEDTEPSG